LTDTSGLELLGEEEVKRALEKVRTFNKAAAESGAVNALLPAVRANTRRQFGALQAGWQAGTSEFINTVPYAVVQEFGGVYIDPTNAILHAWESNSEAIINAFNTEIDSAASQAGFDT
jgi:hypothetical protein